MYELFLVLMLKLNKKKTKIFNRIRANVVVLFYFALIRNTAAELTRVRVYSSSLARYMMCIRRIYTLHVFFCVYIIAHEC